MGSSLSSSSASSEHAARLSELGVFLLSSLMRPRAKEEKKNKWAAAFDSRSKCEPGVEIVKEAIQRGKLLICK